MYNCKYCNKEYKRKSGCTTHEKYYCEKNDNKLQLTWQPYSVHKQTTCNICGNLFDVANIARHEASCGKIDNSIHLDHEGLNCKYCDKLCKNKNSLAQHEIRCSENPNRKDFDRMGKFSTKYFKGQTKETCPIIAKQVDTVLKKYANGYICPMAGKPGTFKGKHHTEESKEKIRCSTLEYLKTTCGDIKSRYNPNACSFMNELNLKFNWKLQHAENGGEISVGGYFLDGYDIELNIVFEYDEPAHYIDWYNNKLKDKDIQRMQFIINRLNCKFYRFNEKLNCLYLVNPDLTINIINN